MEPRVHYYLERAISDSKVKELRADPQQKKELEDILRNERRQLWIHLTFLKNQRIKVYTGDRFPQEAWDKGRERLNPSKYKHGAYDYNKWLDSLEEKILTEVINRYRLHRSEPATKENIQALIKGILLNSKEIQPKEKGRTIPDEIASITNRMKDKGRWTFGTIQIANATVAHLNELEKERKAKLTVGEDYHRVWEAFKIFLVDKGFLNQTANKYLKLFKHVLKIMVKDKIVLTSIDFTELRSFRTTGSFHIALKDHELKRLETFKFSKPYYNQARDLMLLQTYTGQRISDLPEIISHVNNNGTIHVMQKKTKKRVTIPQYPQLAKFIKKIRKRYPNGLPVFAEQNYNDYIKKCADEAGLHQVHTYKELQGDTIKTLTKVRHELVSSHTCRRTFATIAKKNGISDQAIMAVTGHTSHKQFLEYIRLDDDDVQEEFNQKMK
jgi:integrase